MTQKHFIPQVNHGLKHLNHALQSYLILVIGISAFKLLPVYGIQTDGLEILYIPAIILYLYFILRYFTGLKRLSKIDLNPRFTTRISLTKSFLILYLILIVCAALIIWITLRRHQSTKSILYIMTGLTFLLIIVNSAIQLYTLNIYSTLGKIFNIHSFINIAKYGSIAVLILFVIVTYKYVHLWMHNFRFSSLSENVIITEIIADLTVSGIFVNISSTSIKKLDQYYSTNLNLGKDPIV